MKKNSGFTLLEMIFSMGLLVIVLAAVVSLYVIGLRVFSSEFGRSDAKNSAERALSRMVTELRSATQISTYESRSISLTSASGEAIVYSWSGTQGDFLYRSQGSSNLTLVQNVTDLSISYIPTMEVFNLSLTVRSGKDGFTGSSAVKLRNI